MSFLSVVTLEKLFPFNVLGVSIRTDVKTLEKWNFDNLNFNMDKTLQMV